MRKSAKDIQMSLVTHGFIAPLENLMHFTDGMTLMKHNVGRANIVAGEKKTRGAVFVMTRYIYTEVLSYTDS